MLKNPGMLEFDGLFLKNKNRKLRLLNVLLVHQKKAFIHSVSFVLVPFFVLFGHDGLFCIP